MTIRSLVTLFVLIPSVMTAEEIAVNGTILEYDMKGKGPVILFEAGALSGIEGWDAIWTQLPDDVTAIRYARRGEGKSGTCEGSLSADDYSKDAVEMLAQLNISSSVVSVSHSYGGDVARSMAANYPGLVRGMLLLDPSTDRDVEIILALDPENGPAEIAQVKASDFFAGEGIWCFLEDIWQKDRDIGFAEIGDLPLTLISGVKKFQEPVGIFQSDRARELWGQFHSEWVDNFPRGRVVVTDGSGHFVQDDEPELVLQELDALLKRIEHGRM